MFIVRASQKNRLKPHRGGMGYPPQHMPPLRGLARFKGAALL